MSWKEGICNGDWTEPGTYVSSANDRVSAVWANDGKVEYVNCYGAKDGSG
jgi:hypothetical protein